jgi:uncharacterized protein (TIGR00645 family)
MIERIIERLLFASRWLLAPVYLGMALALVALAVEFFHELYGIALHLVTNLSGTASEQQLVLDLLALIDLALVGSLIVMVMFSGYENFVSRIDTGDDSDKPSWLAKLDAGTLKLKVAASIVAISSIHLLDRFMRAEDISNDKLMWYVIIHMAFVFSALLLGFLDKIAFAEHRRH